MRFAEEDLEATRFGDVPRIKAFHAQQAAEKAIKGVLTLVGVEFPKTHNLAALRDLLPDSTWVGETDATLEKITRWAMSERYPQWTDPSKEEAIEAVEVATGIVRAARAYVDSHGGQA